MDEKNITKKQVNIEQMLSQGETIQLHPEGYSMYPMFVPGRDEAVIALADSAKLRKGDVVLYRRERGILVLHRICKIQGKGEGFYFVGDNQVEVEGPLCPEQIKGVLVAFIRKGRHISVTHPVYILTSRIWLFVRPVRRVFQCTAAGCKRFFSHKQ